MVAERLQKRSSTGSEDRITNQSKMKLKKNYNSITISEDNKYNQLIKVSIQTDKYRRSQ